MTTKPRAVFGLPLYNRASYLPEAIESLLGQTCGDFAVTMVDDCSTDETEEIARQYVALDRRLSYVRNPARLGMIRNWQTAFWLARSRFPDAEYFAWASDHDVWHPRWLDRLLAEIDGKPNVVLVYPLSVRVSGDGEVMRGPWTFETRGQCDPGVRLRQTIAGMSAGNMIYGLFRAASLERVGVLREVLLPDRLLLAELSLYGEFRQVPEVLWHRRFADLFSLGRQRASFFPDGSPAYSYLPCTVQHTATLFWNLGVRGVGSPEIARSQGLAYAAAYLPHNIALVARNRGIRFYYFSRKHGLKAAKIALRIVERRFVRRARAALARALR